MRAFVTGGYADLRQVHTWNTDFVRESVAGQHYEAVADEIERALTFMKAIGADPEEFHRVDFHSSHEALVRSLADRVVGVEGLVATLVASIVLTSIRAGTDWFLDAALVVAFVGFVGAAAGARFIERRGG